MKRILSVLLIFSLLLAAVAIAEADEQISVVDGIGREFAFDQPIRTAVV